MLDIRTGGRVTSGYGPRKAPVPGASTYHRGIDIVFSNRNIPSVADGEVVENSSTGARGNYVRIRHQDGTVHTYQHLASRSPLMVGAKVHEGQIIGRMGSSGRVSGAHLHYEVKDPSGNYIDPAKYLSGGLTYDGKANAIMDSGYNSPSQAGGLAADLLGKIAKVVIYVLLGAAAVFLIYMGVKGR